MLSRIFPARDSGRPGFFERLSETMGRHPRARRLARIFVYGAAAGAVFIFLLLALIIQSEPMVTPDPQPAQQYLSRTRALIRNTVHTGIGETNQKKLVLTAEDLTAAANFLLLRKKLEGRAVCSIAAYRLNLTASVRLPASIANLYINIRLIADDGEPQARIRRLKLGRLSIPSPIIGWLVQGAMHYTPLARFSRVGERLIRDIHVRDGRLAVNLNWNRDMLAQAEGLITDLADRERLLVYHDKLAEIVGQPNLKRFVRLGSLMQSLFSLAKSRSEDNNDPIGENRALILVLGAYVNGKNLALGLPAAANPVRRGVLLNRRIDTAQHFMGSATLAMAGHGTLVDMIGLAKEMHDTHNGSGFSFIDLAADQAGALFGKTAIRSEEKAQRIQDMISRSSEESLFMPIIKDLPENLAPDEFAKRFKDIHSQEFQALKAMIQQRILACPLYKP
jgi:hypothetical protein